MSGYQLGKETSLKGVFLENIAPIDEHTNQACRAPPASATIFTLYLKANSITLWIQIEATQTFYLTSKVLLESKMYESLLSNLYWSFLSTVKVYVAYLAKLALNNSKSKTSMYVRVTKVVADHGFEFMYWLIRKAKELQNSMRTSFYARYANTEWKSRSLNT